MCRPEAQVPAMRASTSSDRFYQPSFCATRRICLVCLPVSCPCGPGSSSVLEPTPLCGMCGLVGALLGVPEVEFMRLRCWFLFAGGRVYAP